MPEHVLYVSPFIYPYLVFSFFFIISSITLNFNKYGHQGLPQFCPNTQKWYTFEKLLPLRLVRSTTLLNPFSADDVYIYVMAGFKYRNLFKHLYLLNGWKFSPILCHFWKLEQILHRLVPIAAQIGHCFGRYGCLK